jgi:voltage-gated sodium channel
VQELVLEIQSLLKGSGSSAEELKKQRNDWTPKHILRGFQGNSNALESQQQQQQTQTLTTSDEEDANAAAIRKEAAALTRPPARPFNRHFSRYGNNCNELMSPKFSPQPSITSSASWNPASPKSTQVSLASGGPNWTQQISGASEAKIEPAAKEPETASHTQTDLPGAVLFASEQDEQDEARLSRAQSESKATQLERQNSKESTFADFGRRMSKRSTQLVAPLMNRKVLKYMFGIRFEEDDDELSLKEVRQGDGWCAKIIENQWFDYFICICILVNSALIGVQTNHEAREGEELNSIRRIETVFAVVFTVELLLRIYVYNTRFLTMPGRGWNLFDSLVVGLQLAEEVGAAIAADSDEDSGNPTSNFTTLRVVRILRLIRILRLVRVLRLIGELRMLVLSIISSLKALGWTIVLLILLIYTTGLYLTQSVTEYRLKYPDKDTDNSEILTKHFGELVPSMSTLFQSIAGGLDWSTVITPLSEEISPWLGAFYTVYMAFSVLAMMNVVTGVFVESVLKCAKSEKDLFMVNNARELFMSLDDGMNTQMTWELFHSKLDSPQMQEFFKAIDVDRSEARGLFTLLDLDNSDTVSIEEFVNGCFRLRGPAKSLDLALVIQEVRDALDTLRELKHIQAQTLQRNRLGASKLAIQEARKTGRCTRGASAGRSLR